MKNKTLAVLTAVYMIAGCSSGGGSSGAGGVSAAVIGDLLLTASLSPGDSANVDTVMNDCFGPPPSGGGEPMQIGSEERLMMKTGIMTITVTRRNLIDADLTPSGFILSEYEVSFDGISADAPRWMDEPPVSETRTLLPGQTHPITVVLLALDGAFEEYRTRNPSGLPPDSYNVTVTMRGMTLSGVRGSISARTFLSLGNFDRCA